MHSYESTSSASEASATGRDTQVPERLAQDSEGDTPAGKETAAQSDKKECKPIRKRMHSKKITLGSMLFIASAIAAGCGSAGSNAAEGSKPNEGKNVPVA